MRREPHVRFREGGGVRLPSATRPIVHCRIEVEAQEVRAAIAVRLKECRLVVSRRCESIVLYER